MQLSSNIADNGKCFKQRFNIYLVGCTGHIFQLDIANLALTALMAKFEEYFVPSKNVTFESYKFFSADRKQGVSFDQYLAEMHTLRFKRFTSERQNSLWES